MPVTLLDRPPAIGDIERVDPSRLHPQARAALDGQPREPLTVENLTAVRRSMREATLAEVGPGPSLPEVADVDAAGVPARWCAGGPSAYVIVFAHGGGWSMGDLDTHDGLCRHLAAATGAAVLAVDYRRAPEHPYPAALDDLQTALHWVRLAHPAPVVLAGDSSGAQLAAALALRARDAGTPVAAQVLMCPTLDPSMAYPDLDSYGLHRDEMHFFWDAYAPPGVDRNAADLDVLRADPTGAPPTVIVTAELDILRDEGEYGRRLMVAGVPVVCARYQGMTHDFVRKLAQFDAAHAAVAQIGATLRRLDLA
jgi:acetyl esterase